MWNFTYPWDGDGIHASFYFTYYENGLQLPLFYKGETNFVNLAHRVEDKYLKKNLGRIFTDDKRSSVFGFRIFSPFDSRGLRVLTFRYLSSEGPIDQSRWDEAWDHHDDPQAPRGWPDGADVQRELVAEPSE